MEQEKQPLRGQDIDAPQDVIEPVSYTHLTLPTN